MLFKIIHFYFLRVTKEERGLWIIVHCDLLCVNHEVLQKNLIHLVTVWSAYLVGQTGSPLHIFPKVHFGQEFPNTQQSFLKHQGMVGATHQGFSVLGNYKFITVKFFRFFVIVFVYKMKWNLQTIIFFLLKILKIKNF